MPIKCPVCLKEMMTVTHEDLEVDHCRLCGGLWFDAGEMDKLTVMKNKPKRFTQPIAYDFSQRKVEEGKRDCPRCNRVMKIMQFKDVSVDVCTECRGIWFDRYEVAKILGEKDIPEKAFDYQNHLVHSAEIEQMGVASDSALPGGSVLGGVLGEALFDIALGTRSHFHW